MFPFEWVRETRRHRQAGRVTVLELNPEVVLPAISVQSVWNGSQGIIRGCREGDKLIEDHIYEVIDEDGRLVDVSATGRRIFGSTEMRAQVWTPKEHLAAYGRSHPEETVVAWVGNGNLLSNPHFVAFEASSGTKTLYHLSSETPYLVRSGRSYTCVVVRKSDYKPRVSIETVFFDCTENTPQVYAVDGRVITNELEYVTFGQMLVTKGRPIDDEDLIRMAKDGEFYDLRHLFLFGRIDIGPNRWIDVGLASFWTLQGRLDTVALEKALRGAPVCVDVRQFSADSIRLVMDAKGYDETSSPKEIGQYSLQDGFLRVVLKRGIYPHSMIGVRRDGSLISVAIEGLSNRVGVTICGAADIMKKIGAEDALLIDNGGDVMMSLGNEMVVSSREGCRNRLRSIIIFRVASTSKQLNPEDLQLVRYSDEYAETKS